MSVTGTLRIGGAIALLTLGALACTPPEGGTGLPPAGCYNNNTFAQSLQFNGGTAQYNTAVYNLGDCQGSVAEYWQIVWAANLADAQAKCLALPEPLQVASNLLANGFDDFDPTIWACLDVI